MKRRKKYPRHCCKGCKIMHRSYASAAKHKAEMHGGGSHRRSRGHGGGFASMSKAKRTKIARKGGRASARARGFSVRRKR